MHLGRAEVDSCWSLFGVLRASQEGESRALRVTLLVGYFLEPFIEALGHVSTHR